MAKAFGKAKAINVGRGKNSTGGVPEPSGDTRTTVGGDTRTTVGGDTRTPV